MPALNNTISNYFHIHPIGSKSHTNRAIIASSFADSPSILSFPSHSDDTNLLINALSLLGVKFLHKDNTLSITPVSFENYNDKSFEFFFDNAGTSLRFFLGLACFARIKCAITFSKRMGQRPNTALIESLKNLGFDISQENNECINISPSQIKRNQVEIKSSSSSQFVSALMLGAPVSKMALSIKLPDSLVNSANYIALTAETMKSFGVSVSRVTTGIEIPKCDGYKGGSLRCLPDSTGIANFICLSLLTARKILIKSTTYEELSSIECSFFHLLKQLKFSFQMKEDNLVITPPLKASLGCIDIDDKIDSGIPLIIISPLMEEESKFTGIKRLRFKESDRIESILENFKQMGVNFKFTDDSLVVFPSKVKQTKITTFNDHRIAMGFTILQIVSGNIIDLDNYDCINKSLPEFFDILKFNKVIK